MSLSEYIENCCSKFSNKLVNKIHLRIFALSTLQKVMLGYVCDKEIINIDILKGNQIKLK